MRLNLEGKGRIVADRLTDVVATKVDLAETANAWNILNVQSVVALATFHLPQVRAAVK